MMFHCLFPSVVRVFHGIHSIAMIIIWVCLPIGEGCAQEVISLAGTWRFALDRHDRGVEETWYSRELPDRIQLPGSLPEQGIGDAISPDTPWIGGIVDKSWFTSPEYSKYREPGKVKIPYWLQPDTYYKGAAWYQRDVEIPAAWDWKPIKLFLERAHWETRVWCDHRMLGTNHSLATPHAYDLGLLAPGKHTISVRVDNRMILDIGENSHCISDHTQGNWNGIVGRLELRATPPVRIEDVQVYPDVPNRQVKVMVAVSDLQEKSPSVEITVHVESHAGEPLSEPMHQAIDFARTDHPAMITVGPMPIDQAELWDEFHPALNQVRIGVRTMGEGQELVDQRIVPTGFREFATDKTQF
ncbi:MAG: hypothetical protein JW829_16835, partial [Pirellulales bacterium]|nr:hypothetical protein [Pirellulales bacterium]